MNIRRTCRSRIDMGMHRLHGAADQIENTVHDKATTIARQTRRGLRRGTESVVSLERSVQRDFKKQPWLYVTAGITLITMLITSLFMLRRKMHQPS